MDHSCYRLEKYTFTDGIFNDSVDATYIIHLEGNGRLDDIKKQLLEYHPTNIVYILFNKGFKKCKKTLRKQNSAFDIIDTNLKVFEHSTTNNYSNILILEDDFIFSPDIKNKEHIDNINKYIITNMDNKFVYNLGCIPILIFPCNLSTYRIIGVGMHATIFSKSARNHIIDNINTNNISEWDMLVNMNINRYMYYKPLCYQLFPVTENSKSWEDGGIGIKLFHFFNLDKTVEPGTTNIYILAHLFLFIIFILFIFILYVILSYFKVFKYVYRLYKSYLFKR